MKRSFTLKLIAKDCDKEFKEGMGVGVLAQQIADFDLTKKEYGSLRFAVSLDRLGDALLEECVEVKIEENK